MRISNSIDLSHHRIASETVSHENFMGIYDVNRMLWEYSYISEDVMENDSVVFVENSGETMLIIK